jgi:hypothetical protein
MVDDRMEKRKGNKPFSDNTARFIGTLNFLIYQMQSEMDDRGLKYD